VLCTASNLELTFVHELELAQRLLLEALRVSYDFAGDGEEHEVAWWQKGMDRIRVLYIGIAM